MALLGALSLVQIVVLPGYLLLRALRIGGGIVGHCVLSFALSLVINHCLVAGLVILGIYRPGVIYAVFAVELVLLSALERRRLRVGLARAARGCRQRLLGFFRAVENSDPIARSALGRAIEVAAVLVIGGFAMTCVAQAGQIFQQWDAVVSWNRWAVDWAANRLPYATSIYPQLLPTNLSLTYVFMQSSEVWVFAKSFQFLFCLMLLLAMLDLARIQGQFGYVAGVVITYGLLVALLRFRMLSSGYADMPLAFFALAPAYVLMLARRTKDTAERARYLIAGALLAAGAALTKQTGLYIAAVYPLLAWQFVLRGGGSDRLRRCLPTLLWLGVIMGILVLPWYCYKILDFQAGNDRNNTSLLLTDFHQGRDLLQRAIHAAAMIVAAITPMGAALLSIAVAASLRDPIQRWLTCILVVPLGSIWAIAFSYDLRNLAVIIPWAGAAAGIGLMRIVSWMAASARGAGSDGQDRVAEGGACRANPAVPQGRFCAGHAVGVLMLVLIVICLCISDHRLLSLQRRQQRMVGVPELNSQLYAYAADHPSEATIATDYQAMRWLPELGPRSVVCTCHEYSAFRQTFDRPEIRYVLVRMPGAVAEVREFLAGQVAARLLFESHGFAFFEKRPVRTRS
jgi:hypothetical protein